MVVLVHEPIPVDTGSVIWPIGFIVSLENFNSVGDGCNYFWSMPFFTNAFQKRILAALPLPISILQVGKLATSIITTKASL